MNRIFEFLPKKALGLLLGLLILVQLANFGLQRYQDSVTNQTKKLQTARETLVNEIKVKLETNQSYGNLVHFLAIKTLFDQKKSILDRITNLAQLLPKSLAVTSLTFKQANNTFLIEGITATPDVFLIVAKYFDQLPQIEVIKRTQSFKEKDNTVQIKLEGRLK